MSKTDSPEPENGFAAKLRALLEEAEALNVRDEALDIIQLHLCLAKMDDEDSPTG